MGEIQDLENKIQTNQVPKVTMLGPITEAYQANVKDVIDMLNKLRATELTAELQYRHHAYMAVSLSMPGVKAEFLEHATVEAKHADMLATRIEQLGGDPIFNPVEIAKADEQMRLEIGDPQTLPDMIAFDYQVERNQIVLYTNFIREIGFKDPTTRRILEDILMDTEDHAAELRDLLSQEAH